MCWGDLLVYFASSGRTTYSVVSNSDKYDVWDHLPTSCGTTSSLKLKSDEHDFQNYFLSSSRITYAPLWKSDKHEFLDDRIIIGARELLPADVRQWQTWHSRRSSKIRWNYLPTNFRQSKIDKHDFFGPFFWCQKVINMLFLEYCASSGGIAYWTM